MNNPVSHSVKRLDLQGIRALAVIVVVLFHAGVNIPGGFVGVDIFFVLSGFLIIGLLTRELETPSGINFGSFWAKRARRLIPASALVLVFIVLVSRVVMNVLDARQIAVEALWASLFGANWFFVFQGEDYMADEGFRSPVQHFWSLGVEEQFYFVVPLVFGFLGWLCSRWFRRMPIRLLVAFVLLATIVVSFSFGVWLAGVNPESAYFHSGARIWQLAAGGLLAVVLSDRVISRGWSMMTAFAGVLLIGLSLIWLSGENILLGTVYPSYLALAPTVGTVLLILAGVGVNPVSRVLSWAPFVYVGDISYSLYLWHAPFLIFGGILFGSIWWVTVILVAGSLLAAALTFHGLEDPVRGSFGLKRLLRPSVSVVMAASCVLVTFGVALQTRYQQVDDTVHASVNQVGVMDIVNSGELIVDDSVNDLEPSLDEARDDEIDLREKGCQVGRNVAVVSDVNDCTFGEGRRRVFIVGDSIGPAMFPAVREAGGSEWSVTVLAKSGCTIADNNRYRQGDATIPWKECFVWRDSVMDTVIRERPDLVIVGASEASLFKTVGSGGKRTPNGVEDGVRGLTKAIERLRGEGLQVALVEAPVIAPFKLPSCLADTLSVQECSFTREGDSLTTRVVKNISGVQYVNTSHAYCDEKECVPVVGRQIVFRDQLHFTKTFVMTYVPQLERILTSV